MEPDYGVTFDILDELEQRLSTLLDITSEKQRVVAIGNAQIDECCQGAVMVQLSRIFWVDNADRFPIESRGPWRCGAIPVGEYLISVARCVPTPDARGRKAEQATRAANEEVAQWLGMIAFDLQCWVKATAKERPVALATLNILGPEGGCITIATTVWVALEEIAPPC
jgi:hypothetical protein